MYSHFFSMVNKELLKYLSQFTTPQRLEQFLKVLDFRTRYITVVLEDIYHSQNASAVLRTCDCFGIQDVHIIENRHAYDVNPDVALGSDKWLTMHKYNAEGNNTELALNSLKAKGYQIIATSPHVDDVLLEDFDVSKGKFALVFGTELHGVSDTVKQNADAFLRIPMYGMTESYNISVSAAMCLHHLVWRLHNTGIQWNLTDAQSDEILFSWLMKSIKRSDLIVDRFLKNTAV